MEKPEEIEYMTFSVRLPKALVQKVDARANEERRSRAAQIEVILRDELARVEEALRESA